MLVVHWSPVNNSKNILNNGINKNKNGVYCFPLTGHISLDRWWMKALKRFRRDGKKYNGFVFKVIDRDLPAYLGHYSGHTNNDRFEMPIRTLKELGNKLRETIIWRIGEEATEYRLESYQEGLDFLKIGQVEITKRSCLYTDTLSDCIIE